MTLKESQKKASETQGVEEGKFDRHMRRARINDIMSRQETFIHQSEASMERRERNDNIEPSVY